MLVDTARSFSDAWADIITEVILSVGYIVFPLVDLNICLVSVYFCEAYPCTVRVNSHVNAMLFL